MRDAARTVQSELKPEKGAEVDAGRQVARAEVDAVFEVAERLLAQNEHDVAWVSDDPRRGSGGPRGSDRGRRACCARSCTPTAPS